MGLTLVDTSVWIDHFRKEHLGLIKLLEQGYVVTHPYIIGELSLGNFKNRIEILRLLKVLPQVSLATEEDIFHLIEIRKLYGKGIGLIDAHLLVSALIDKIELLTFDKKLNLLFHQFKMS